MFHVLSTLHIFNPASWLANKCSVSVPLVPCSSSEWTFLLWAVNIWTVSMFMWYDHRWWSRGGGQLPPLADKGIKWYQMPPIRRLNGMMPASTEKSQAYIGENVWNTTKKCVKFACNYFKNPSASGGLRPPDSLTGFRPWTPLENSHPQTPCDFASIPNLLLPPLDMTIWTFYCLTEIQHNSYSIWP